MDKFKHLVKMFGATLFMGMGAFGAGMLYVIVIEHLTGKPIDK
jgi:hypothetical protein